MVKEVCGENAKKRSPRKYWVCDACATEVEKKLANATGRAKEPSPSLPRAKRCGTHRSKNIEPKQKRRGGGGGKKNRDQRLKGEEDLSREGGKQWLGGNACFDRISQRASGQMALILGEQDSGGQFPGGRRFCNGNQGRGETSLT